MYVHILQGVKEVTLLGQNVNSYRDTSQTTLPLAYGTTTENSQGFRTIYKAKEGGRRFVDLLDQVSRVRLCTEMKILRYESFSFTLSKTNTLLK